MDSQRLGLGARVTRAPPRGLRPKRGFCLWGALKSSLSSAVNERVRAPGWPDVLHAIFQAHKGRSRNLESGQQVLLADWSLPSLDPAAA